MSITQPQPGVLRKDGYLVVYDYGMGGVWAFIKAETPEAITLQYPKLKVVDRRPEWMSDSEYKRIRDGMTFRLEEPSGWLAGLNSHD